jgi:signal transduction histidine kinase/FixJ family two-component response regulator
LRIRILRDKGGRIGDRGVTFVTPFLERLSQWPSLASEEATQRARTFFRVSWASFAVVAFFLGVLGLAQPETAVRRATNIAFLLAVNLPLLALNRRGYTKLASWLLVAALGTLVVFRSYSAGGIGAPVITLFFYVSMVAGVLLGTRGGAVSALVLGVAGLALVLMQQANTLPPPRITYTPVALWLFSCMALSLTVVLYHQITMALTGSARRADAAEAQRERLVHDLGERVKELKLLHSAARLLQHDRPLDAALFQELVGQIPDAWQFPECCEARISFGDIRAQTPGWSNSAWMQTQSFSTSLGIGLIEVVYLEQRPPEAEGPFLVEERSLLQSLAEIIVSYVELRSHREGLEELVATRTRELSAAKDEAERASRAKSTFLATMSHEIRTPMNAVLGYAQLLLRDASIEASQRQKVNAILSSGEHLLSLINDVLEMSKIEAGRVELVPEPFELRKLLGSVDEMCSGLARARGLTLTFEVLPTVPAVIVADPGKVRQVVINLLSNALKFTVTGGVRVRASARLAREREHQVEIAVIDTGPGIDADDMVRIFGKFEQTRAGTRGGGTGLGLSIGRSLARMMDGDLTVQSALGQGSNFSFRFGAREVAAASEHASPRRLVTGLRFAGARPKLLVVDDQADNLALAVELLQKVGFETRAASSGEAALEVHDSWRPNLVLTDLRMPGMGGIELLRRLKAAGSTSVLVAFTASGFFELEEEARRAGASDVLLKPYREAELLERLAKLLAVELVYQSSASLKPIAPTPARVDALGALFAGVPRQLLDQLKAALIQARAVRIEQLAAEISAYSPDAAAQVRALATDFRYAELASALEPPNPA